MPKVGQRFNPHRMFDGVFIPEAVCQYKGISPGAKLAYGRFCRFAGKTGEVFPSMATLGKEIGCGQNQARSYVRELVDDHFVEVEPESGGPNTYYFVWHAAFEGEIGSVRFSPLQDPGGVEEIGTPPGSCGGPLQDPGDPPLQDPGVERESVEESQGRESVNPPTPFDPETLNRTLCSRFKRLRGVGSFPRPMQLLVERRVQRLDSGFSEDQIISWFEDWSGQDFWRAFDTSHKVQSFFAWCEKQDAGPTRMPRREAASQQAESPGTQPQSRTPELNQQPPTTVPAGFPERWNVLVPEKPVDVTLLSPAQRQPRTRMQMELAISFGDRFEEICSKARDLIGAGGDVTYGFLFQQDRQTEQYRWQQLLAGQLGWMAKRQTPKAGGGESLGDMTRNLAARMRAEHAAKKAETAKEPDRTNV